MVKRFFIVVLAPLWFVLFVFLFLLSVIASIMQAVLHYIIYGSLLNDRGLMLERYIEFISNIKL